MILLVTRDSSFIFECVATIIEPVINFDKLIWNPADSLETGLLKTIQSYQVNSEWLQIVRSGTYQALLQVMYGKVKE